MQTTAQTPTRPSTMPNKLPSTKEVLTSDREKICSGSPRPSVAACDAVVVAVAIAAAVAVAVAVAVSGAAVVEAAVESSGGDRGTTDELLLLEGANCDTEAEAVGVDDGTTLAEAEGVLVLVGDGVTDADGEAVLEPLTDGDAVMEGLCMGDCVLETVELALGWAADAVVAAEAVEVLDGAALGDGVALAAAGDEVGDGLVEGVMGASSRWQLAGAHPTRLLPRSNTTSWSIIVLPPMTPLDPPFS